MRLERTLPAMTAIAVLMLTLTACGGNSPAEAPGQSSSAGSSGIPVQTAAVPLASPVLKPGPSAAAESEKIQGSGTYVGQMDPHSVEIVTEEGPTAFELGAGTADAPEGLEMDDPVVFTFVEKIVGKDPLVIQRVLSSLTKAD